MNSHLLVLSEIVKRFEPKKILEFGLGDWSTRLFSIFCQDTTSVEMNHHEWFTKLKNASWASAINLLYVESTRESFRLLGDESPMAWKLIQYDDWYDLVFVDANWRWQIINKMACENRTNLIVAHDTQAPCYDWHKLVLPANWKRYDNKFGWSNAETWTSVFTTRSDCAWVEEIKFTSDMTLPWIPD